MSAPEPAAVPLLVAALCAEWCNVCRDWQPAFDAQAGSFAGRADFAWIDIEDHEEVIGELEVESFPTVLIARGDDVLFYGAITPHPQVLIRLVRSACGGELEALAETEALGLPGRVRATLGATAAATPSTTAAATPVQTPGDAAGLRPPDSITADRTA